MKKVLEALRQVLKFKSFTTLAELSSLVKYDKLRVMIILNDNDEYIRKDKNGKILGFTDWKSKEVAKAFNAGKIYKSSLINYGAASELEVVSTDISDIRIAHIKEYYICGGFGDSYTVNVIIDKPENRAKLKELGYTNVDEYKFATLDQLWKE